MNNQVSTVITPEKDTRSYFDGGLWAYFGISILAFLGTFFSLGIAYPWMMCMKMRWEAKHTVVCGKRMYFDGRGGQLFGKYILWFFLSIITIGIFALFMNVSLKKWQTKHLHFEDSDDDLSLFDGGVPGYVGIHLLAGLITVATFGLCRGIGDKLIINWEIEHTVIDSHRLVFTGSGAGLWGRYLLWGLLCTVTFGIFSLTLPVRMARWTWGNTIDKEHSEKYISKKNERMAEIARGTLSLGNAEALKELTTKTLDLGFEKEKPKEAAPFLFDALCYSELALSAGVSFTDEEKEKLAKAKIIVRRHDAGVKTKSKAATVLETVFTLLGVGILVPFLIALAASIFSIFSGTSISGMIDQNYPELFMSRSEGSIEEATDRFIGDYMYLQTQYDYQNDSTTFIFNRFVYMEDGTYTQYSGYAYPAPYEEGLLLYSDYSDASSQIEEYQHGFNPVFHRGEMVYYEGFLPTETPALRFEVSEQIYEGTYKITGVRGNKIAIEMIGTTNNYMDGTVYYYLQDGDIGFDHILSDCPNYVKFGEGVLDTAFATNPYTENNETAGTENSIITEPDFESQIDYTQKAKDILVGDGFGWYWCDASYESMANAYSAEWGYIIFYSDGTYVQSDMGGFETTDNPEYIGGFQWEGRTYSGARGSEAAVGTYTILEARDGYCKIALNQQKIESYETFYETAYNELEINIIDENTIDIFNGDTYHNHPKRVKLSLN